MRLTIPETVIFSDLNLSRSVRGVEFDWAPIERICEASGIDLAVFRDQHEDNVAELLTRWYAIHVAAGGERNAVADDLWSEAVSELN